MPTVFDDLIDIQHVPDPSLITDAQTSGRVALTNASRSYPSGKAMWACHGNNRFVESTRVPNS